MCGQKALLCSRALSLGLDASAAAVWATLVLLQKNIPPRPRPPSSQLPMLALPPLCHHSPTFRVSHFSSLTSTRKKADKQAPRICEVSLNIYNYFVTVTSVSTQLLNNYYPTISPYYYILYYISIYYTIYYYITIVPDLSLLPPSLSSLPLVIFS